LPHRSQFNRLVPNHLDEIEVVALGLAEVMEAQRCPYEALDSSAMAVGDAKRLGSSGWLAGYADVGWSKRPGWYEGFRLLVAVNPAGVLTGFGSGSASTTDQQVAETLFFGVHRRPEGRLASVGRATQGMYIAEKGFEGIDNHRRWLDRYGAQLIHSRNRNSRKPWSKRLRRCVAGIRQIVESVYDKLFNSFGLHCERPHDMAGLRARLARRVALHNFSIWLNERLGGPRLTFADLLDW
jgi:hypothetical protein